MISKAKKAAHFLCAVCIVLLCLSSCSSHTRSKSAREILTGLMEECDFIIPDGCIYEYGAEEGSEGFLSPSLISALYGEEAPDEALAYTDDYAIYLSGFAEPYEIAVFHCRAESDTDKLYAICSERIDQLKVLLLQTSYAGFADTAQICIHGKYVIMISVGEQSRSISRKIPYAV